MAHFDFDFARRHSAPDLARGDIVHQRSACGELSASPNCAVIGDARTRTDSNPISNRARPCDTTQARHDSRSSNLNIVAYLTVIIDLCAHADSGRTKSSAIDTSATADFDIIFQHDISNMRNAK